MAVKAVENGKARRAVASKKTAKPADTPKVFFLTYGCTFNFADTDALVASAGKKFEITTDEHGADVVVINTCSVKGSTQEKILYKARLLDKKGKRLVITGCLAQVSPELVEATVPRASIIGPWSNSKIAEAIGDSFAGKKTVLTKKTSTLPFNVTVDGVFARVQISRGCLGHCTYCSTRIARGNLQSFPQDEIVIAVESAIAKGAKEIQLTSQDTACYGFDFEGNENGRQNLAVLLRRICAIPGRFRVRIGMGNPEHFWKIRKELAQAISSTEKAYRFLHIPVQSGSDAVLKAMGREYATKDYEELVAFFYKKIPDITIETDIIVGFPDETENDFEATVALVEKTRPEITNVSKYSARPKTFALTMKQLDRKTINERSKIMSDICRRIAFDGNRKMIGRVYEVLMTQKRANGFLSGRTQNYKTVLQKKATIGEFITVGVTSCGQCHLKGKLVKVAK